MHHLRKLAMAIQNADDLVNAASAERAKSIIGRSAKGSPNYEDTLPLGEETSDSERGAAYSDAIDFSDEPFVEYLD